jgi:hypothetical protein
LDVHVEWQQISSQYAGADELSVGAGSEGLLEPAQSPNSR